MGAHYALSFLSETLEPWYALRVKTRSESTCLDVLKRRGYTVFCPTYPERKRYVDRWKLIERALFPGYLFCRFDVSRKVPVIGSYGVDYIVGGGLPSSVIPEVQIEHLQRMVSAGATPTPYLTEGQRVRVIGGALAGVEGILARNAGNNLLVVSISILQRSAALHVQSSEVTAIP